MFYPPETCPRAQSNLQEEVPGLELPPPNAQAPSSLLPGVFQSHFLTQEGQDLNRPFPNYYPGISSLTKKQTNNNNDKNIPEEVAFFIELLIPEWGREDGGGRTGVGLQELSSCLSTRHSFSP